MDINEIVKDIDPEQDNIQNEFIGQNKNDIGNISDTESEPIAQNNDNSFNDNNSPDESPDGRKKKSKKDKRNKENKKDYKNFLGMSKNMKIMGGIFIIFIIVAIFALKYLHKKSTPTFLRSNNNGRLLIHNSNTPFQVANILKAPLKKKSIMPAVNKSNKVQTISKPTAINKVMPTNNKLNNTSVNKNNKKISQIKSSKNSLNDLFSINYKKHSSVNSANPVMPGGMPNQQVPPIKRQMPNFNVLSIKNKLKSFRINGSFNNNFSVSGYSGGFVMVNCNNKNEYIKVGGNVCGYTLLRADSSVAVFSKYGKAKNFTY
jgi:hypothetical protein